MPPCPFPLLSLENGLCAQLSSTNNTDCCSASAVRVCRGATFALLFSILYPPPTPPFALKKNIIGILLLLTLAVMTSCDRQGRHNIIPERAMTDVLYDYQLAVALADEENESRKKAEKEYLYTQAVFQKHGITEDEFNLSVAHYARNPKTLLAITEKVSDRYTEEMRSVQDQENAGRKSTLRTDTILLWKSPHDIVLSGSGVNRCAVEVPCKGLKRGDRLLLGCRTSWIYREGSKQGYMQVAVTYANDSTSLTGVEIREYANNLGASVFLSDFYDVKRINIHIYQDAVWRAYPQLLWLKNLAVWSIRTSNINIKKNEKQTDSSATATPERRLRAAKPDALR